VIAPRSSMGKPPGVIPEERDIADSFLVFAGNVC
jgi:hypothetical protein